MMRVDKFGNFILSEKDLIEQYLTNTDFFPSRPVQTETHISFDEELDLKNSPILEKFKQSVISVEQFDEQASSNWYMPEDYKNLDIAKYVLDLCEGEEELQRAGQELIIFQEKDSFDLLRYLKFLVDMMRANNIVWGVGRGSSVSSFVLYLIGVHKINPIFYGLSIDEFLR